MSKELLVTAALILVIVSVWLLLVTLSQRNRPPPVVACEPVWRVSKRPRDRMTPFELQRITNGQCPECNWAATIRIRISDETPQNGLLAICGNCEARFFVRWNIAQHGYTSGTRVTEYNGF
jgi:hypothetical protein